MTAITSIRARQRRNVLDAYRARADHNSNLWLVYSVKTNCDWILPSDRQLVHWIHYLETDHAVHDFDLTPDPVASHDGVRPRCTELDAVVHRANGIQEWHEVKASLDEDRVESQLSAQAYAAQAAGVQYKIFTDVDLMPHAATSLRWLKAIAYASAIRDREYVVETGALISCIRSIQSGQLRQVVESLSSYDSAIVLGLAARVAIRGRLKLSMDKVSFGPATEWQLTAGASDVDA
ncbi:MULTISPECIES: hypothetical protein [Noviherbaspirillum]|uniref:TnsA endonuclease N-terminal domain-containing protein n=1 Tax=Noviherbaspirillum album TaxID=3080276 RepID=A0ABU6J4I7_9BURK|nr:MULTISPECIES: hypothetical protein [Noviherbaspirillum]MEC4718353.1 hypothetical protein [Noviherbaspirillum sp. CPCC 100848]